MGVRAKFVVQSVLHMHGSADQKTGIVTMIPVYAGLDGVPANAEWSKWTPSGEIKMTITTDALEQFELGKSYFVDFSPA
jgi:hypothetical protein